MNILNKSDCVVIILHEIYGINDYILSVCKYYSGRGFKVICPNLLGLDYPFTYEEEEKAYDYFMKNVGFELAAKKVTEAIVKAKQKYKHVILLGFSIGATIAWLCSEKEPKCEAVIGYYGSRIRNYANVVPTCKTLLIFAAEEKSFNVMELEGRLKEKANTEVYVLPGKHGFTDKFSKRYNEESCSRALKLTNDFEEGVLKGDKYI